MLGWSVGMVWKVALSEKRFSLAAVGPEEDTSYMEDVEVSFEVIAEDDDTWTVKTRGCGGPYEVAFFKHPLAIKEVVTYDKLPGRDEPLKDVLVSKDIAGDHIQDLVHKSVPFLLDFPMLEAPLDAGEALHKTVRNDTFCIDFDFVGGRPFWAKAVRKRDDEVWSEGALLE